MKRLITIVVAAAASFAVLTTPAFAATVHKAGSCRAQGDFATCVTSGTADHPATIRVHVSATSSQNVTISWDMTCTKGLGAGGKSGQFTAHTPVSRVIHHPYAHPDSCIVSADAQLSAIGHLHVWVTYTR
jgi:hypothetical protein